VWPRKWKSAALVQANNLKKERMGMRVLQRFCQVALIAVLMVSGVARADDLPEVVILATGGTIAGASASGTQAGYTSGQVTIDAMIKAVPDLSKVAKITGEQVSNVGSQDMSFDILLRLARRIEELAEDTPVDGIVVTHGTDTMEESAYFLNLLLKTKKPVVLVGSMRPSTAVSADGPLNIFNAVSVATDPKARGRGVMMVMNDQIHDAQSLIKTSTTAVETFQSPLRGLLGISLYGKNTFYRMPHQKYGKNSEFSVDDIKSLPRVDIVYGCTDMPADLIDASVARGAKGIVIAGVGNGNMTKAALEAAAKAVKAGVIVVRSTRATQGIVGRNVEVNDDEYGFVASESLNPQKARVLLSVALTEFSDAKQIQRVFKEY
jgi:L-asparaginase